MQFGTHLLFLASWLVGAVHSLACYSCTATLSSAVDESAQIAMRIFLEVSYLVFAIFGADLIMDKV
jgi:threonine/homoserine/homoserine lactone efflux protein